MSGRRWPTCSPTPSPSPRASATSTWREFDHGADGVAQFLLDLGVVQQDKVAIYLYNCPEYLQTTFAAVKVGLVPVNTNYRYGDDELSYLWENADAIAVVFHGAFADRIERILDRVPGVKGWLWVDDGSGPCPDWATPVRGRGQVGHRAGGGPVGPQRRRPLHALHRRHDRHAQGRHVAPGRPLRPADRQWRAPLPRRRRLDAVRAALEASPGGVTLMPACPLMHGTGGFTANTMLAEGGRVCLLESRKYDPAELLDTVEREKVNGLVIVGDPFSRPLLAALDAQPGRLGPELAHHDHFVGGHVERAGQAGAAGPPPGHAAGRCLQLVGGAGHGRLGLGQRRGGQDGVVHARSRREGAHRGRPPGANPGSDEVGVLALGGRNPLGYYKDEEKSDRTFKVIDGVRYSIPGDFAQVDGDGTIHLLGRGSVFINSGGEKIFPEEVEEALKTHHAVQRRRRGRHPAPDVRRADRGRGRAGPFCVRSPAEAELIDHVKERLASYKAPRRVRAVATIGRAPNGKVDYKRHRTESMDELGVAAG